MTIAKWSPLLMSTVCVFLYSSRWKMLWDRGKRGLPAQMDRISGTVGPKEMPVSTKWSTCASNDTTDIKSTGHHHQKHLLLLQILVMKSQSSWRMKIGGGVHLPHLWLQCLHAHPMASCSSASMQIHLLNLWRKHHLHCFNPMMSIKHRSLVSSAEPSTTNTSTCHLVSILHYTYCKSLWIKASTKWHNVMSCHVI